MRDETAAHYYWISALSVSIVAQLLITIHCTKYTYFVQIVLLFYGR